jgi:hypothetical protein
MDQLSCHLIMWSMLGGQPNPERKLHVKYMQDKKEGGCLGMG